ncbi:L-carnitine dehydratase/bile acid-inducible protein F [Thermus thermophilus SG0.5JP17-16]|uniref:L-carnitine dehydratase/bile acid-inducible protein F n=1 Tax=Thermus thermophilus (strain SG0.5JP17-16) TaxID=762633 RepID=F6DFM8_THETG|nr:CoA transferase [Thermus thermophilus]AEG33114.1 L-carnitine dehydratase/bile acid-inducible protein F [Thermus thermophilus SG0.5JP17-16]
MAPSAWPPGKVLDLTRLLPGPLAGKLLLEMGFPVLKVEPPGGDPLKALAPEAYRFLNEGKEVLVLDLKAEEGRKRLLEWVREAAILLESNRPGVMERLGLGPEVLLAANPRLVYLRLRGYPDTPDPGHDLTYLAEAGLLGRFPWRAFQFADLAGAYALALAALKGLLLGGGVYEVALSEAVKSIAYPPIPFLDGSVLCYGVYPAAEGEVALAALEPHLWARFCQKAGLPELVEAAFSPASPENPLYRTLCAFFAQRPARAWEAWAREEGLPLRAVR